MNKNTCDFRELISRMDNYVVVPKEKPCSALSWTSSSDIY